MREKYTGGGGGKLGKCQQDYLSAPIGYMVYSIWETFHLNKPPTWPEMEFPVVSMLHVPSCGISCHAISQLMREQLMKNVNTYQVGSGRGVTLFYLNRSNMRSENCPGCT